MWDGWAVEYMYLHLSLTLPNGFTKLLFHVILPTILGIAKLNHFCQSTRCEVVNHSEFSYHFPDYW